MEDEGRLFSTLSLYVFLNYFLMYLANNFYILGVGQLTIKPMTCCKRISELLWSRGEGGGSILLLPKMWVMQMRRVSAR